eukprot:604081-Prymnesium_polylepis.2
MRVVCVRSWTKISFTPPIVCGCVAVACGCARAVDRCGLRLWVWRGVGRRRASAVPGAGPGWAMCARPTRRRPYADQVMKTEPHRLHRSHRAAPTCSSQQSGAHNHAPHIECIAALDATSSSRVIASSRTSDQSRSWGSVGWRDGRNTYRHEHPMGTHSSRSG